jgi:hypothetical protein
VNKSHKGTNLPGKGNWQREYERNPFKASFGGLWKRSLKGNTFSREDELKKSRKKGKER